MAEEVLVSIEGRQAYFWALQELWPEVLDALRSDVSPIYEPQWHRVEGKPPIAIANGSWDDFRKQEGREVLQSALQRWADRFAITEPWILETAIDTLLTYYGYEPEPSEGWLWRYNARGFHARFEPQLSQNIWYPPSGGWPETWEKFKARMESEFGKQLSAYGRMVEVKFGIGREEQLVRDARWTVLYQKGQSVITTSEDAGLIGYSDPEQTIFRAITRFAELVGLNLRRRGQRRPRRSVQA